MEQTITLNPDGSLNAPARPVIPFIAGDGIGPDIWRAAKLVIEAAVEKAYQGERGIVWKEVLAGEKAKKLAGDYLPKETLQALAHYRVGLKGPLGTPVGGGIRSLNVAIRKELDLYACLRPVKYIPGVPSPVRSPEKMNMIIFRENTEDVYAGLEWPAESPEAESLARFVADKLGGLIRPGSAIGLKPMSRFGSQRLIRMAIKWALAKKRRSVTLVHKGNIMKYTEGAFRQWGYDLAKSEFGRQTVPEAEWPGQDDGRVLIKDRIADNMFMQTLLRPDEYEVLAMPNLNGDYLSDALAAQVGGLGMAPGANIGDGVAVFEATHGTAPKYAGQDKVNPCSLILSATLMLEHMGWVEASELVERGLTRVIADKVVTYDLARQMPGVAPVKCSEFAKSLVERL